MLRWHRLCAILSGFLLIYVVFTGTGIELADMRALMMHAPATDPDMLMMRQHIYGPPNYAVVSAPDYTAPALPAGFDIPAAIGRAASLGRAAMPGAALRLVEVRMVDGKPAGHVQMADRQLIFDLGTGAPLASTALPPPEPPRDFSSSRAWFKGLHRFNYIGQPATALNLVAGIALGVMIVTGLMQYSRLLKARARGGRSALFWRAGNWWRDLHRWISISASLILIWLSITGIALSLDNVGAFLRGLSYVQPAGPSAFDGDQSSPLHDSDLSAIAQTTLIAFRKAMPNTGVKVLRLRNFVAYHQGVVVAADTATSQLVFNTDTGARMSMSEKGYPDLGFPAGWEWHQRLKKMHRGDIFGMTGRWLESAGALSLVYMTMSGMVMYSQLWLRRRKAGRPAVIWR